jgi:hypothetical protein
VPCCAVGPNDYVFLVCVADIHYNPEYVDPSAPALGTQLLHGNLPVDTTHCASAAKRAGMKFFGPQFSTYCMGGNSLVRALRYTNRPAKCILTCAASDLPGRTCGGHWDAIATSLYVLKSGKGEHGSGS